MTPDARGGGGASVMGLPRFRYTIGRLMGLVAVAACLSACSRLPFAAEMMTGASPPVKQSMRAW